MDIQTTLDKYKTLGEYFAPEYLQRNEVLEEFKKHNPLLSGQQVAELTDMLNGSDVDAQYFVADLLYLYPNFDRALLEPMLHTAIYHRDPSFNRLFMRPCVRAFGVKTVANYLTERFRASTIVERIGIANLVYWLMAEDGPGTDVLHDALIEQANNTSHLIELYYYKLLYGDAVKSDQKIPRDAMELMEAIRGNAEYEDLVFNKLGWAGQDDDAKQNE